MPDLRVELLEMQEADQAIRREMLAMMAQREADGESPVPVGFAMRMMGEDAQRLERLKAIVDEHGWPDASMVGEDGAHAAWLILQHAGRREVAFMERCEPLLRAAVERGEASEKDLAYLVDRIRMYKGEPQVYGTQFQPAADGELTPYRIEDPEGVDERRAAVGLPPMAEAIEAQREAMERVGEGG